MRAAADAINSGGPVTLLVGQGARHARAEVMDLAARLNAPMVLTLKAKEGFDDANDYEVGQSGLIGNHATAIAFEDCDTLVLLGTDFPYRDFLPEGKTVVQLDVRGAHIGRRTPVDVALVGDAQAGLRALLPMVEPKPDTGHLEKCRSSYHRWQRRQLELADPAYESKPKGLLRRKVDNPEHKIRPELVAATVDRLAGTDAVFTSDTGMATVWLSRFVRMTGRRRLVGSLQPRLHGQRDAAGARGPGPRPSPAGRRLLRRRRPLDAARRPDHRREPRPARQARRVRQRPARDGQARDGAGGAPGVRDRPAQPRLLPRRGGLRPARLPGRAPRRGRAARSPPRSPTTARHWWTA